MKKKLNKMKDRENKGKIASLHKKMDKRQENEMSYINCPKDNNRKILPDI